MTLDTFKDSDLLFLNIWRDDCKVCDNFRNGAMSLLQKPKYSNNITFLNISLDGIDMKEKWTEAIEKTGLLKRSAPHQNLTVSCSDR